MNTVLVLDDCAEVLDTVSMILDDAGFNVVLASEPDRGVSLCGEVGFDVVICDLCMTDSENPQDASPAVGIDAIWTLRERFPKVPIVAMSGAVGSDVLARLQGLGLSGVLEKPFTAEYLLKVVRKAVQDSLPPERRVNC